MSRKKSVILVLELRDFFHGDALLNKKATKKLQDVFAILASPTLDLSLLTFSFLPDESWSHGGPLDHHVPPHPGLRQGSQDQEGKDLGHPVMTHLPDSTSVLWGKSVANAGKSLTCHSRPFSPPLSLSLSCLSTQGVWEKKYCLIINAHSLH